MAKTNWQLNDTVLPSDMNQIGTEINELQDQNYENSADYVRYPAFASEVGGTGKEYWVTLDPEPTSLPNGFGITFIPFITNQANPTLNINFLGAIPLKDQRGNPYAAGKLLAGKPYTFRKVGTDFLADSSGGSGNAVAGDIRAGKTATTDNGDVVGTLPVRTGGAVTPSTVNQTKQAGIYDTDIVVQGDADLIAENIKKDINIFGVVGNMRAWYGTNGTGTIPPNSYIDLGLPTNATKATACWVNNSYNGDQAWAINNHTASNGLLTLGVYGNSYRVTNNRNEYVNITFEIQAY